jgi:hypothetical protein
LWLAQLEEALAIAQRLVQLLPVTNDQQAVAQELHLRIQAVRLQVQATRLGRGPGPIELRPEWTDINPWRQSLLAAGQTP